MDKSPFAPLLLALTLAVPLSVPFSAAAQSPGTSADFPARVLRAHNGVRQAVGARPLQWSDALARSAAAYGPQLATSARLVHSPRATRPGESENLWMGTRGAYPVEAMVGYWADERRMFSVGLFPNVSTTGDWLDVSHYTQMIWPETTHVGCHLARSRAHDFLICRYSPRGNRDGVRVGAAPPVR